MPAFSMMQWITLWVAMTPKTVRPFLSFMGFAYMFPCAGPNLFQFVTIWVQKKAGARERRRRKLALARVEG
jgi:hypothetical protein